LFVFACSVAFAVQAEARTFRAPSFEGYRLHYCKSSGSECGERVATEWCVTQGYEYASDWGLERDIGAFAKAISVMALLRLPAAARSVCFACRRWG